jgi:CDGSH-type Zn-finger protein
MSEAIVAQNGPRPVDLQAGRHYASCASGRSTSQPYCDTSHDQL